MRDHAVVIAGGGPTGLMLAGELALAGVDVSIVERRASQALAGFTEAPGAERVMLVDERPAEDKTQSFGAANIFKCTYGVFRIADDSTEPSRMTLLRSDLAAALGSELDGRSIIVRHYGLYMNNARQLR